MQSKVGIASHMVGIARVLARRGILGALRGKRDWPPPSEIREALEELGTVFMKFGQVLALRRDLLPAAYADELAKLHDALPPMTAADVRVVIQEAAGAAPEQLFSFFAEIPIAAATIAQVHAARLHDGRAVVVKVQRRELERKIARDIATLTYLATIADRFSARLRTLDPVALVREFHDSLRRESDFREEAENIRRFRTALSDVPDVWIPDVVPELSSRTVLVMEHSPGARLDQYLQDHPGEARRVATALAALVLRQIFEQGLFHADPHPGNVFALPDGRLCLHDFGMIGQLTEPLRAALEHLLEATVNNDARLATDAYLEMGLIDESSDRTLLEADLAQLLDDIHKQPLREVSIGQALEALLRIGAGHSVRNPGPLLLLTRALLITEAMIHMLDPELSVVEVFRDELSRVAAARLAPERLLTRARATMAELERLARDAPGDVRRALRRLADGNLGRVRAPELEALGGRVSRGLERLTGGVVAAALIVGGALLLALPGWHHVVGIVLLLAGITAAITVGVGALRRR